MKLDDIKILASGSTIFSLKKIIAPKIITILYLLGLAAIVLFAISHLFATFSFGFGAGLWGLLEIAVFGLLSFIVLRISCEAIIVFFNSHKNAITSSTPPASEAKKSLIDDVKNAIEELANDEKQKTPQKTQTLDSPIAKKTSNKPTAKKPIKRTTQKSTSTNKTSK